MIAIQKKIVVDERGRPKEVIISWNKFCEMCEALGIDLDKEARLDLHTTRRDWNRRNMAAFKPLSAL
jgi:hypothetical protein